MSNQLNIYLCSQSTNCDYDTYDSFVGAFESEEEARNTHPSGDALDGWSLGWHDWNPWCGSPDDVTVKLLGLAVEGAEKGVITASFNAG